MNLFSTLYNFILDLFFPRRCPICDQPVKPFSALICESCEQKVRYIAPPFCRKCGKSIARDAGAFCYDCNKKAHLYDKGMALFEYQSVALSLYRFKYQGRREYADYYAERMWEVLGRDILALAPQAIVPVPIHISKKRKRGYNQAQVLAKALGKYLQIPVETELIKRVKKTIPLKDLGPLERYNNIKGAFKITQNDVKLNTLIIIDDIYTTGSTVDEMARLLRSIGVKHIYVITLAIGKGM